MRYRTPYSLLRSFISVALALSLFEVSTPAASKTIVVLAKESSVSLKFWAHANGLMALFQGRGAAVGRPQENQEERDLLVDHIEIFPGNVTITFPERVSFLAVASIKTVTRSAASSSVGIHTTTTAAAAALTSLARETLNRRRPGSIELPRRAQTNERK